MWVYMRDSLSAVIAVDSKPFTWMIPGAGVMLVLALIGIGTVYPEIAGADSDARTRYEMRPPCSSGCSRRSRRGSMAWTTIWHVPATTWGRQDSETMPHVRFS